jgi:hypothetical protein
MADRKKRLVEFDTEASWTDLDVRGVLANVLQDAGEAEALTPIRVLPDLAGTAIPTDWPTWVALRLATTVTGVALTTRGPYWSREAAEEAVKDFDDAERAWTVVQAIAPAQQARLR